MCLLLADRSLTQGWDRFLPASPEQNLSPGPEGMGFPLEKSELGAWGLPAPLSGSGLSWEDPIARTYEEPWGMYFLCLPFANQLHCNKKAITDRQAGEVVSLRL